MKPRILALTVVCSMLSVGVLVSPSHAEPVAADPGTAHPTMPFPEAFSESGDVSRVSIPGASTDYGMVTDVNQRVQAASSRFPAEVVKIQETGPVNERFNIVFLGDGYTRNEQDKFVSRVREKWNWFNRYEPFTSYKNWFNVYAVKVISRESGADQWPRGARRDTALGSTFSCSGIERLLCVDTNRSRELAKNAPKTDLINVLVNTDHYGGAGYPTEGIATAAADNPSSADIMVHEVGHSLGGLMDEYDYGGGTYSGPEPSAPNVSTMNEQQMRASGKKWAKYLGRNTPDGGKIGTYLGGYERYANGIYRPSQDSMMRSLGKPFNIVSQVAIIKGIRAKAPAAKPGTNPANPKPEPKPTVKPTATVGPKPSTQPQPSTQPTVRPTSTSKPTSKPTSNLPYDPNDPGQVQDWNLLQRLWDWLSGLFGPKKP